MTETSEIAIPGWNELFDAIELHAMQRWIDSDEVEYAEPANNRAEVGFYSVLLHLKTGGLEHCCDFPIYQVGRAFAARLGEIYNMPFYDYAKFDTASPSSGRMRIVALGISSSTRISIHERSFGDGGAPSVEILREDQVSVAYMDFWIEMAQG